jgi:RNA polymerase sporulation-specific sigma factor
MNSYSSEQNRELIFLAQNTQGKECEAATEKLICENMGLVRHIALKFCGRGCEYEDLVQIGTIGMLKAIRSFDLDRGTAFSTYAVPLILGEIRRHLRDDGPIKVGRSVKKLAAELMREQTRIISETGKEPHISELAEICGVSPEEAATALDAVSPMASLSDTGGETGEGLCLYDRIPDGDGLLEIEHARDRIALSQAIRLLPPLWRQIISLRYFKDLTQQKTAELLGLTQVKVSREEKKIVEFLRAELTK